MNPGPMMDSKGRMWFNVHTRLDVPAYCKAGSDNPFAKNYPIPDISAAERSDGGGYYDPKSGQVHERSTLASVAVTRHSVTTRTRLSTSARAGVNGLGWIKTRVWDETHDAGEIARLVSRGDRLQRRRQDRRLYHGATEPPDPKLDRYDSAAAPATSSR